MLHLFDSVVADIMNMVFSNCIVTFPAFSYRHISVRHTLQSSKKILKCILHMHKVIHSVFMPTYSALYSSQLPVIYAYTHLAPAFSIF